MCDNLQKLAVLSCTVQVYVHSTFLKLTRCVRPALSAVQGWLDDPIHVSLGADEPVPPGLQHQYMVVPADRKLAALCRQIRLDLKA